jgi:regulatory protein
LVCFGYLVHVVSFVQPKNQTDQTNQTTILLKAVSRRVTSKAVPSSDRWLQLAVRALARSDRTTAQIERLLAVKGAPPSQVRATVRRLLSLRYLDDVAFAARWIDRRLARTPMGRARLHEELLATGCPEPIVQSALRAGYRKVSERELAMQVVRMAGRINSTQPVGRLARLLNQRGFDEDTIETVMGPLMRERNEDVT